MKITRDDDIPISGINITPVIDVSLVLLLIILISSPVLEIPNIPVNLPQAVTVEAKERNITVSLAKDGRLSVDTDIIQQTQLQAAVLRKLGRDRDILVIIRADKDVPYGKVESILELLATRVGARNVAVATQQKEHARFK